MPNENAWSVIAEPASNSLILGVDFPAAGRHEAGFDDLVKGMGTAWSGHGVLQTSPPPVRLADRPSGDFYTDHWMRSGDWEKYEVVAVLGYCVGAVYAGRVAERLAAVQGRMPQVVLFDAQLADLPLLASEMHKMIGQAAAVLSEQEAEEGRKRAVEIVATPSIGVAEAAGQMVELYRELAASGFRRIGLSESRCEEMVLLFESYMTWLSASSRIDPAGAWGDAIGLTSADYGELEKAGATTVVNAATAAIGRRIPVETRHIDLLRDASTVRALLANTEF
ncbi:hypothetical protein [Streptomyces chrestomyceticus]|uniref:Uncharacterized protein n=1 Tax=Streptomyces chrestomyceticus TaxID=68185 RepID=A0ABU7WZZ5_9ACTN